VKQQYAQELERVGATYEQALAADAGPLRELMLHAGTRPALFVGSGGTMAIAALAAALHEQTCRQPARAVTALGALDAPVLDRRGTVLFSSSAKHADAQQLLARFATGRHRPAGVVTHRAEDELRETAGCDTWIVQLPPPAAPDGFLATNSIVQMTVMLLRAYLDEPGLARQLADTPAERDAVRDEVLILAGNDVWPAAVDLEVRLAESGLAAVQLVDYRNFAHGRHTSFARRIEQGHRDRDERRPLPAACPRDGRSPSPPGGCALVGRP
jgi:hypothetical protein